MRLSQRQINRGVLATFAILTWLLLIAVLVGDTPVAQKISSTFSACIATGLLIAYWRGWEYSRHIVVIMMTLLVAFLTQGEFLTEQFSAAVLVGPVLALILVSPAWVLGSAIITQVILVIRAGGVGPYADPIGIVILSMIYGGLVLSRLATDNAQRLEEANTRAAEALDRSERQAKELTAQAKELAERNDQQKRLLDLVTTLETPTIALADGVLLAPVVGSLDSRRAQALTNRLLEAVNAKRAHLVVLDIAGVTVVDTEVAQSLLRTIQAVRLLGCDVTVTGIAPAVALTLTQLGIQLTGVSTAPSPQEALRLRETQRQRALSR
ncbi:MAG: STAS domain-containing protein [Roseiflexaceae bacterium]